MRAHCAVVAAKFSVALVLGGIDIPQFLHAKAVDLRFAIAVQLELADHQIWRTRTTIVAGGEARVTGSLERIR